MVKVQEKELSNYIENFNNKNIKVITQGLYKQEVKLHRAECTYNTSDGKLKIHDDNSSFEIDTSFIYLIETTEDFNIISFYFEEGFIITIAT